MAEAGRLHLPALLDGVQGAAPSVGGSIDGVTVTEVRDDSRQVGPGDLFVAVPGAAADGRRFVGDAAARGATVLVTEAPAPPFAGLVITVPSARRALARIAANRFGAARAMTLLAVTGTNGKTTTTYLVEAMLRAAGRAPGVIGTVTNRAPGLAGGSGARAATLTTPGALALQALLAEMRGGGATDVVLEATSIALEQSRLDGCAFRVAGMTNVTQDHLDYHGTMEAYFDAKAILFERLIDRARGVAVTFVDQDEGLRMRQRARAATLGVARAPGVGAAGADVVVERAELDGSGLRADMATPAGRLEIASPLVGEYNLSNVALAVGMAVARELPLDAIAAGAAALGGVPGRLERVGNSRGVLCLVDYAHTPDALERALAAVRPLARGRVIVVFGCGGDRDRGKRPLMGEVAARDADLAVVTSDNPRTEEPGSIIDMIVAGVRRVGTPELAAGALAGARRGYHREADRRAAIRIAAAAAAPGDVLLIAGKGHEDYQILGTTKIHLDDREEAAAALGAQS
jgi:UDP-N-acetylmuramoyl-L-alanyl-D-glutamate--2,6-diaminopimelate ligase